MNIDSYAFSKNSDEIIKANRERLEEIKHLKDHLDFRKNPEYKRTSFAGTINKENDEAMALTEKDLFLIVTDGHIPFGGYCNKNDNSFSGAKYTD